MKLSQIPLLLVLLAITASGALAQSEPILTVSEPLLGQWEFQGLAQEPVVLQVQSGASINFSWLADPGQETAVVEAYRYGWDLLDPDDPNDPGWMIPWLTELIAPSQSFLSGIHGFTVQVRDDQGRLTRGSFLLDVQDQVSVERIRLGGFKSGFVGR